MTNFDDAFPAGLDWTEIGARLDHDGYAVFPGLLDGPQARAMAALIGTESAGRRVSFASSGRGHGDEFLLEPLPEPVGAWRAALYEHLVPIANGWSEHMDSGERFPATFDAFRMQNEKVGQLRSQSSLSRLREQDYQFLHQRAEGEQIFPLQMVLLLSEPGRDFTGGELVMTEQRSRMQTRPVVLPLGQGDAALITVAQRPVQGSRGDYRVNVKHAVSRVRSGERVALELLFHDAV